MHITASATRPSLADQNWKTFFRVVGNDLSQGPAAGNYIKNVLKAEKVYVIDDQSAYGAGLADEVKKVLGASGRRLRTRSRATASRPTSPAVVTKVKAAGADGRLLRRLLPGGRPDPQAAHRCQRQGHRWSPATASTTSRVHHRRRRGRRRGHHPHLPVPAGHRGPRHVQGGLQGALRRRPGHLQRHRLRRREHPAGRHQGRRDHPRQDAGVREGLRAATALPPATSSPRTASSTPAQVKVWAYKVAERQGRSGPGDQVSPGPRP